MTLNHASTAPVRNHLSSFRAERDSWRPDTGIDGFDGGSITGSIKRWYFFFHFFELKVIWASSSKPVLTTFQLSSLWQMKDVRCTRSILGNGKTRTADPNGCMCLLSPQWYYLPDTHHRPSFLENKSCVHKPSYNK